MVFNRCASCDELKAALGGYAVEYMEEGGYSVRYFAERAAALEAVRGSSRDVHVREVTLEDAFLKLTGRKLEEGGGV